MQLSATLDSIGFPADFPKQLEFPPKDAASDSDVPELAKEIWALDWDGNLKWWLLKWFQSVVAHVSLEMTPQMKHVD